MQCDAVCCSVVAVLLQCVAVCCSVLQCVITFLANKTRCLLMYVAVVLQCIAVFCNVAVTLQCVAVRCCSASSPNSRTRHSVLQRVAACCSGCSVLQWDAV